MTEETITVSVEEYNELRRSAIWASALECVGVDGWEGCDEASEVYREMLTEAGLEDE